MAQKSFFNQSNLDNSCFIKSSFLNSSYDYDLLRCMFFFTLSIIKFLISLHKLWGITCK